MIQPIQPMPAGSPPVTRPRGAPRSHRLVTGTGCDWDDVPKGEILLVCPWLQGLDPATGLWLAALPIHDCNGFIDSDWFLDAPAHLREHCYIGVFALDRLRSAQQLLGPLREKGVSRLINLPSVGFFDGATAQTFDRLSFNLESEMAFLAQGRSQGFGTALCARDDAVVTTPVAFDFILRHSGPGGPLVLKDE